jgi:hypothetical protein
VAVAKIISNLSEINGIATVNPGTAPPMDYDAGPQRNQYFPNPTGLGEFIELGSRYLFHGGGIQYGPSGVIIPGSGAWEK